MIDLRLLQSFIAVAELEHVGRAATRLHVSQSPLSRQMHKLEDQLGLELFARAGRRIRLTAAGAWLVDEAKDLVARGDRLEREARRRAGGEVGSLAIGYVTTAMWSGLLPSALRRFAKRHPEIRLQLRNLPSPAQIGAVARGDLDLGLVQGPPRHPELRADRLLSDRLLLAVGDRHRLARRRRLVAGDLHGAAWIALAGRAEAPEAGPPESARAQLIALCARGGFVPDVRYEATDRATVLALVAAGLGVALVPASARGAAVPGVRLRELSWLVAAPSLYLIARVAGRSPAAAGLRDEILSGR